MAAQVASYIGKKILKESAANKFGQEDPYFEQVPASRLNRAFGKKSRKSHKAIPPGLSESDAKILNRVKRRAYRLDYSLFNLCGIRFGWGSVIGLIPVAGDGIDAALALMVARECKKIDGGLPQRIYTMMLVNVIIDLVIGFIPFVGDLADAIYKCNTRNAIILEKYLREKSAKQERAQSKKGTQQQIPVDLSIPEEFDRYEVETTDQPPHYEENELSGVRNAARNDRPGPSPPRNATLPRNNRRVRPWFGGSCHKQGDIESGGSR